MADKRILTPVKLVDSSGSTTPNQLAVVLTAAAVSNSTAGGILSIGSDGSNYRVISTDTGGKQNVNASQSGTWAVSGTGSAGTAATGVITVQGIASMTALKVDGSGVTQPVSGTVTANAGTGTFAVSGTVTSNIGTTNGLALDTSVNGLLLAQASTTSGQSGPLLQGATTTAAPTYTTAKTNPLSLTTAGALRVDASATTQPVSGTFWQATQPVSGTVAVTQSTSPWIVAGGGTAGTPGTAVLTIQGVGSGTAVPVSGTFWQATQPVSGTITANAGTGTFAISASSLPLPTGAATSANQASLISAIGSTTSGQSGTLMMGATTSSAPTYTTAQTNPLSLDTAGNLRVNVVTGGSSGAVAQGSTTSGQTGSLIQGAVTTGSPTYTTAQTSPISLTTAGAVRVDASATTQPVSGTVTANAGSGTFTVSGTVTANAGTGTLSVTGTGSAGSPAAGVITVQGNASGTPIPVTGTFTDDLPTSPNLSAQTSAAVAAGSSATLTTGDIGAQFMWQVDIACSVAYKAVIGIILNGTTTNYAVLFGRSGETIQYKPASRKFWQSTSSAGVDGFSVIITNLDTSDAADVYATFYYSTT